MKTIEVTMSAGYRQVETSGEDDQPQYAQEEIFQKCGVVVDQIRNWYPRKPDRHGEPRPGTRIMFRNGSALPVKESFEEVSAMIRSA